MDDARALTRARARAHDSEHTHTRAHTLAHTDTRTPRRGAHARPPAARAGMRTQWLRAHVYAHTHAHSDYRPMPAPADSDRAGPAEPELRFCGRRRCRAAGNVAGITIGTYWYASLTADRTRYIPVGTDCRRSNVPTI
jgi:hypothetical protein